MVCYPPVIHVDAVVNAETQISCQLPILILMVPDGAQPPLSEHMLHSGPVGDASIHGRIISKTDTLSKTNILSTYSIFLFKKVSPLVCITEHFIKNTIQILFP